MAVVFLDDHSPLRVYTASSELLIPNSRLMAAHSVYADHLRHPERPASFTLILWYERGRGWDHLYG